MDKMLLKDLLRRAPECRAGILGDFCVDVYWDIHPEKGETSIETGLLTTPVTCARYSPGGAGNIAANLRGIGVRDIPCFGAVGRDPFGIWLKQALAGEVPGASAGLLELDREDAHTSVYCKPLLNGEEQSRIDLGNTSLTDAEADRLLACLEQAAPFLKVLIINEQIARGIHTPYFRKAFAAFIRRYAGSLQFVFDGRDFLADYPGVLLKINAEAASQLAFGSAGHVPEESGNAILRRTGMPLVITDGENGCTVFEPAGNTHIPAIRYDGPVDTVGAGDSFTAGFACALALGTTLPAAAGFGTCCSAVTVRKLRQTGVPTPAELLAL